MCNRGLEHLPVLRVLCLQLFDAHLCSYAFLSRGCLGVFHDLHDAISLEVAVRDPSVPACPSSPGISAIDAALSVAGRRNLVSSHKCGRAGVIGSVEHQSTVVDADSRKSTTGLTRSR